METNLLPIALSYLNRGWSVIPVGKNKIPLIQWKEYQNRLASPEELVKWWEDYPEAQIGIVCGEVSNLTVVDIEEGGDFNLILDKTFTVKTGGGGRHYYFKYEKDFKNAVKVFPKVDTRSQGGYVVGCPSLSDKGGYVALNTLEVSQMSTLTRNMFLGAFKRILPPTTPAIGNYPKISTEGLTYEGVSVGERNEAMTKFAGVIHAKLHSSLWPSLGLNLFTEANKKNSPPLSPNELRIIWSSIGSRETRQNPEGRIFSDSIKTWGPTESVSESLNDSDPGAAIDSHPDSLSDSASDEDSENSCSTLHIKKVAERQIIDTDNTYSTGMVPFDEALLGGFSPGELVVVAGLSGSGKTTLLQDWSVTLAMGKKDGKKGLPVLWFSYEVYPKPLWTKFQAMGATEETPLYMPTQNESGEFKWVVDVIQDAVQKWGIKVVVFDHLGFLRPPKGNYSNMSDAITHTVRAMREVAKKLGLIILFQVHVKKNMSKIADLNDIKDSSGIGQESDTVFFIAREKDTEGLAGTHAKVQLIKNRKTGMMISAFFDYRFGRYYHDESNYKSKEDDDGGPTIEDY